MYPLLLTIDKHLEKAEDEEDQEKVPMTALTIVLWGKKEEGRNFMPYKETCSLCKGNGYITIVVEGKDEIKQCWLCESKGEKEYSQAEVDKLIYETYYKNERRSIDESKGNQSSD